MIVKTCSTTCNCYRHHRILHLSSSMIYLPCQNEEAGRGGAPAPPHLPGGLPGRPRVRVQGGEDPRRGREHPPVREGPHRLSGRPPFHRLHRRRQIESSGLSKGKTVLSLTLIPLISGGREIPCDLAEIIAKGIVMTVKPLICSIYT